MTDRRRSASRPLRRADPAPLGRPCYGDDLRRLLLSCGAGEIAALGRLYDETVGWVYPMVCRATPDRTAATTLATDVYRRIWIRSPHFDATAACAVGWVLRQVRDQVIATAPGTR